MRPMNKWFAGRVELRYDNKSGVRDCLEDNLKTHKTNKFRGLLRATKKTMLELSQRGLIVTIKHVKGHQDDLTQFDELSR